jgi:TPR repeat protein
MSKELLSIDTGELTEEDKSALNQEIDQIIAQHKNNRMEINRLVFESVEAMTDADNAQAELSEKGFFRRLAGNITGSNQRLQNLINSKRAVAQYAGQQTLQKLAEQNLMSFDLVAAVNNKLNTSIQAANQEFQSIYQGLQKFLRHNQSEMVRLETRLEKVERNVNLLTWQNSIEYLDFEGREYADLDTSGKIVCLVRDFLDITKGNWSTSDLLLLKTAMSTIGLEPKRKINYWTTMQEINDTPSYEGKLLAGASIKEIQKPAYLLSLAVLKKLSVLNGKEVYVINTIANFLSDNGLQEDRKQVRDTLTSLYLKDKVGVNVDTEVECYDLILDLLYNLYQGQEENLLDFPVYELKCEMENAEILCQNGNWEEAKNKIEELAKKGYGPAMKRLGDLFQNDRNYTQANQWYEKAGEAGDEHGWVSLANAYYNGNGVEQDYEKALEYYHQAYDGDVGDKETLANRIGQTYYKLEEYGEAITWYKKSEEAGCKDCWSNLGNAYYEGNGVEQDYEKALEYYHKAYDEGVGDKGTLANSIGQIYDELEEYDEAITWYKKSEEAGCKDCWSNLGNAYYEGNGVEQDYEKALEYYHQAYNEGVDDKGDLANSIGQIYEELKEYDEAITWFEKSGEAGSDFGWLWLGAYYIQVTKEYEKAREYYQKAYDLNGDNKGLAANRIGGSYYEQENFLLANKWFQIAGEIGTDWGWYNLGNSYIMGKGVEQDYEKAQKYYQKAYDLDGETKNNVAYIIGYTYDKQKNYEKAIEYYEAAYNMNEDDRGAIANKIGLTYDKQEKYVQASIWFQKASEAGYGWGWNNLGNYYENGNGVEQNYNKAIECYKKGFKFHDDIDLQAACAKHLRDLYKKLGDRKEYKSWSKTCELYS